MELRIVTPASTQVVKNVDSISFPGAQGDFTVLRNHAPLVSTLKKGSVCYTVGSERKEVCVEEGVVEVFKNTVELVLESSSK